MSSEVVEAAKALAEPIKVIIEKISSATGILYQPTHVRRMAKADSDAKKINLLGNIELNDIQQRAMSRLVKTEEFKQQNVESILDKAIPLIENTAQSQDVENDWLTNFFGKCENISDVDMQMAWAKILAGEINDKGAFSKRTINLFADFSKEDAQLFTELCAFLWSFNNGTTVVFDYRNTIFLDKGLNFSQLTHLDAVGLIKFNSLSTLKVDFTEVAIQISYHDSVINVTFPENNKSLPIGSVILTQSGRELSKIAGAAHNENYFQQTLEFWRKGNVKIEVI